MFATNDRTRILLGDEGKNEIYEVHIPKFSALMFSSDLLHAGSCRKSTHIVNVDNLGEWSMTADSTDVTDSSLHRIFCYCSFNNLILPQSHREESLFTRSDYFSVRTPSESVSRYQIVLDGKINNAIIQEQISFWKAFKNKKVIICDS
jgi:hypothetical protein